MKKMFLIAGVIFISKSTTLSVNAQVCQPLCGSQNQMIAVQTCADQTLTSKPFEPCCDNGDSRAFCDDNRKCRSVEFNGIVGCSNPSPAELHCINPAESVQMSVSIDTESRPGACCADCSCSGDPHCFAFNNKEDDFIVCDARDVSKNCAVTKAVCDKQKDQTGTSCVYSNSEGTCTIDPLSPTPTMLFYQKGDTAITLSLGDRGVTSKIAIKQGNNILSITAIDCQNNPTNPWVGKPIGILESVNNGKIWKYMMPGVHSQLTVHCLGRSTFVRYPRLELTLVDFTSTPGGVPSGVTGFCGTGEIEKGKSTTNVTDAIRKGSLCANQPLAITASFFNNEKPVKSLSKAINSFCKKYMKNNIKGCTSNITSKDGAGWAKVFCAANTILSKNIDDCNNSQNCVRCTKDIEDFGWLYAIDTWDITKPNGPKPGATCIKISELPPDLTNCDRGIRIQYFQNNTWNTYRAIPSGFTLCESSGTFNNNDDPELFQNRIRFTECGSALLPPGTCPNQQSEVCNAEDGFVVTLNTVKQTETPQLAIVELVDKGKLICNPSLYPNDANACFKEQLNPCPSCTGNCKPTGYNTPCDNSQDACGTCPAPV